MPTRHCQVCFKPLHPAEAGRDRPRIHHNCLRDQWRSLAIWVDLCGYPLTEAGILAGTPAKPPVLRVKPTQRRDRRRPSKPTRR